MPVLVLMLVLATIMTLPATEMHHTDCRLVTIADVQLRGNLLGMVQLFAGFTFHLGLRGSSRSRSRHHRCDGRRCNHMLCVVCEAHQNGHDQNSPSQLGLRGSRGAGECTWDNGENFGVGTRVFGNGWHLEYKAY